MKIAAILRQAPVPLFTGLNLVIQNLLNRLAISHEIRLFVLDDERKLSDFPLGHNAEFYYNWSSGRHYHAKVRKIPMVARYYCTEATKLAWLESRIKNYRPERVVGFGYDLLGYFGLLNVPIPKILDIVDSEILFLMREILRKRVSLKLYKHLIASLMLAFFFVKRCAAVITVSEEDMWNIKRVTRAENVFTIPNGVDYDYYCPDESTPKMAGQVVFTGSLNWPPNQQAIMWFLENCWNIVLGERPDARLIIIGKSQTQDLKECFESYPNVKALGFVDDIRDSLRASQVSIAPLISGSGIKNKILEAWAMKLAVVATSFAAKGIKCEDGVNIILADNPNSFSSQVIRLLNDSTLCNHIGTQGRRNVIENYSWNKITDVFTELISCAAGQGRIF